ncbi:MAG: exodeoxyribonuclease VII large subunit [Hyphomicrobiaceae bacterium]
MPTDFDPDSMADPGEGDVKGRNTAEYSVTELAGAIKRAIEGGFGYVRLRGEISGYRGPHASGHCYFALKDDKAKIEAVIWRGVFSRLRVKPEEGMEVIAQGRVTTYPNSSKYQIVIERLEPAGVGALMALLEERKRKFAAEGLFDEDRKRPLPFLPSVIGIVTSPTGAVIRDMMAGFIERFPAHVVVWPARVQGEGSAAEIAAGIRGFNALQPGGNVPRPDVLIVARGGGSLEDLWSFNEEIVVRAAAESDIPLISAVGHETDWTLIDLVADARAPTPTKAAEWAVPKYSELKETTQKLGLRADVALRRLIEGMRAVWRAAARGLPRREDILALPRQRFDAAERRLGHALIANTKAHHLRHARVASRLAPRLVAGRAERLGERLLVLSGRSVRAFAAAVRTERRRLDGLSQLARSLSYQSVLERGFALVRDEAGAMVRRAGTIAEGQMLELEFADGRIGVGVGTTQDPRPPTRHSAMQKGEAAAQKSEAVKQDSAGPAEKTAERPRRRHRDSGQGSLF